MTKKKESIVSPSKETSDDVDRMLKRAVINYYLDNPGIVNNSVMTIRERNILADSKQEEAIQKVKIRKLTRK